MRYYSDGMYACVCCKCLRAGYANKKRFDSPALNIDSLPSCHSLFFKSSSWFSARCFSFAHETSEISVSAQLETWF